MHATMREMIIDLAEAVLDAAIAPAAAERSDQARVLAQLAEDLEILAAAEAVISRRQAEVGLSRS